MGWAAMAFRAMRESLGSHARGLHGSAASWRVGRGATRSIGSACKERAAGAGRLMGPEDYSDLWAQKHSVKEMVLTDANDDDGTDVGMALGASEALASK